MQICECVLCLVALYQRRNVGGDEVDGPRAIEHFPSDVNQTLSEYMENGSGDKRITSTHKVLAPRDDGLVREMKTRKVVSREQIQERTETEDVKHLGDFSDEVSKLIFIPITSSFFFLFSPFVEFSIRW